MFFFSPRAGHLIVGTTFLLLAILTTSFSLFELALRERTHMRPGLPAYDMWTDPKPEVLLSIHIFTIENAQQFLDGTDSKLEVKDLGPIVYREITHHSDIVFHSENSTMSYTANRTIEFVEYANEPGILNRTIIVPNFAVLVSVRYLLTENTISLITPISNSIGSCNVFIRFFVYYQIWF